MMKRVLGWLASYVLYGIGHVLSKPMLWWDWAWLYAPYNALMGASSDVQEWGGGGGAWYGRQHTEVINAAFGVIENHDSGTLQSEHIERLRAAASALWGEP